MKRLLVILLFMVFPVFGMAATIHVPGDQPTIQAGIDAAVDGDTVLVAPDTYVENINFNGKAITVQSEQEPEVTIIDSGGRVVKFQDGEGRDSVLNGFTIRNGTVCGVYCDSWTSPTISNNIITDNSTTGSGGGIICLENSSPLIANNTITDNSTTGSGGGIFCTDGAFPLISNNSISGNSALAGGGILCQYDSSPHISNNSITDNSATGGAGGIACIYDSSPQIYNNTIMGNSAEWGGGIYCSFDSSPQISGNTIANNAAGAEGGGIQFWNCSPVIINNLVKENSAPTGAGIAAWCDDTGCLPATITGNIVSDNVAALDGGGIVLGFTQTTPVLNNIITGNTALTGYGAGINVNTDSDVLIANNTITGNSADVLAGGGIAVISGSSATLVNNIILANISPTGKEISLAENSTANISYCDVEGGQGSADVEAGSTLNWGAGMIDEDPLFEAGPDGDYYLGQDPCQPGVTNPCVDTGDPASNVPWGTTRTDCCCDSGTVDMGYHYPGLERLVVGPGPAGNNPPLVRVVYPLQDAGYEHEFSAYGAPHYGVNVTCGDVNGDDMDEIITGAGPGDIYGPHVRGFQVDSTPLPGLSFMAYGTLKYGVNVAAGDIDGDGYDEIITGAGPGAVFGPHVRAFDYDGMPGVTPVPGVSYFAYGTPKWGVNVSAGDIDGDGYDEIVTGAGPGAAYGPHVRGWNVDGGTAVPIPGVSYFAYGTLKFGVNVSCGDVDGDGIDEIVTGPGPGAVFGAQVRGWNVDGGTTTAMPNLSFFAWSPDNLQYGAKVSSGADLNGNGRDEIVVGQGPDPNAGTWVKVYTYDDGSPAIEWFSLEAFGDMELTEGANVAAGKF